MSSPALRAASVAVLLASCQGDRTRTAAEASDRSGGDAVLEVRVARGHVERAALVGGSHLLVQVGDGELFLHRRADGARTPLVAGPARGRRGPQVVWAQAFADDSVAVYDFRSSRVTVFDTSGAAVRTTSLEAPTGTPAPVAAFRGGNLLVQRDYLPSPYVQETGQYADTSVFMPVDANAQPVGPDFPVTMALRYAALDRPVSTDEANRRRPVGVVAAGAFDGKGRHSIQVPLSPATRVAAAGDGFYLGRSDSAEVRFMDPTGREVTRFRISEEPRAVDAATEARLRRAPDDADDLGIPFAELYRDVSIPSRTPRYRQLRADRAGRLWVERFPLGEQEPSQWTVYARDGTRLGTVTLAPGSRLLDVTDREVLIVRDGALGGELLRVQAYRLR